jgi:hypothetical protein
MKEGREEEREGGREGGRKGGREEIKGRGEQWGSLGPEFRKPGLKLPLPIVSI